MHSSLFSAVFRVDSSYRIGVGHLIRCLTLAQSLKKSGARCTFICKALPGNSNDLVTAAGFELIVQSSKADDEYADAAATAVAIAEREPQWLIVDHYGLGKAWEIAMHAADRHILALEDMPNRPHQVDVLLDPTYGRVATEYEGLVPGDCQMLLGTDYALLGPAFLQHRAASLKRRNTPPDDKYKIVISLGGGETSQSILCVIDALHRVSGEHHLQTTIVLGNNQASDVEIRERAQALPIPATVITRTRDMAVLFANHHIAIGAAGGTTWERCCLGLPTLVLTLADNQRHAADRLVQAKAVLAVPQDARQIAKVLINLIESPDLYRTIARNAASLCDGTGVKRVHNALVQALMNLRRTTLRDADIIWQARYGGNASHFYYNPAVPSREDHIIWLTSALGQPGRILWIAQLAGVPVGHIRLDIDTDLPRNAELSIYIVPDFRGQGIGKPLIEYATRTAFKMGFVKITAEAHADNTASQNIFTATGYTKLPGDRPNFIRFEKRFN